MGFWRRVARAPVTAGVLLLLIVIGAMTMTWIEGEEAPWSRRALGTAERLTWVTHYPDRAEIWHPELYGPFDLWSGEWWRVPVANLHHADWFHLLLNGLFVWSYGAFLERQWGSWRTLVFSIGAGLVALPSEYLVESYAIGYSGVCCAIYGALWGMRERRPAVADVITNDNLVITMLLLVGMVVLTELDVFRIANLAHFTGLGYGWLVGKVVATPWRAPRAVMTGFVLAHGLLVIPYWAVVHPFWIGRYHWYLATLDERGRAKEPDDLDRIRRALAWDPSLGPLRLRLAELELLDENPLQAWSQLLQGLKYEPTHQELWETTRRLWRRLVVSPQRAEAERLLTEVFGTDAETWRREIRRDNTPPLLIAPDRPPPEITPAPAAVTPVPWSPSPDPWWWRDLPRSVEPLTPPDAAVEGETL
jgi:membrane associated rhomboid family serine protease